MTESVQIRRSSGVQVLFAAAATGIGVYGITFAVLGALLAFPEMQARLHIDAAQKGTIFLSLYAGVFVSNVVIGPLIEARGVRTMLIISALLVSAGLLWFSALTSWYASLPAAAMLGFGGGSLNVAVNSLVADIYPHNRATMLNFLGVFFGVGAVSIPLGSSFLISHFSVPHLFVLTTSLPVVAAIFYSFLSFPSQSTRRGIPLLDAARVLRYEGVMKIGLLLFFENANEAVVAAWTSTYALYLGCGPHTATLILTCYWASMMFGRAVAARLIRRLGKLPILLGAAAGATAGCTLLFLSTSSRSLTVAVVLTGLSFAPIFKTALSLAGDRHPHATAPIFGVLFAMSLIGAMLAPWIVGQVSQHSSVKYGPLVPLAGCVGVAVMTLLVVRSHRANLREQT